MSELETTVAAAADDAGGPPDPSAIPTGPGTTAPRRKVPWRLVGVGVVLVAAMGFLIAKGLGSSLDYFETVDQAMAHKAILQGKTFRLEGVVAPGTVHQLHGGVRFVAVGTHDRIVVTNHGSPPQLFQPDIPVVVVGHFSSTGFDSDQIIVDHTAQYQEAHPGRVRAPNGTSR